MQSSLEHHILTEHGCSYTAFKQQSMCKKSSVDLLLDRLEDFLELILIPSHNRLQTCKLPNSIDLSVIMLDNRVTVTLHFHFCQVRPGVGLVRGSDLVVPCHFCSGNTLVPALTEKMLRLQRLGAQEIGTGDHGYIFFGVHRFPSLEADLGVVDLYLRIGNKFMTRLFAMNLTVTVEVRILRNRSQS